MLIGIRLIRLIHKKGWSFTVRLVATLTLTQFDPTIAQWSRNEMAK